VLYSLGLSLHVVPCLDASKFVRSKSVLGAWWSSHNFLSVPKQRTAWEDRVSVVQIEGH
jgi:hypothetical protein